MIVWTMKTALQGIMNFIQIVCAILALVNQGFSESFNKPEVLQFQVSNYGIGHEKGASTEIHKESGSHSSEAGSYKNGKEELSPNPYKFSYLAPDGVNVHYRMEEGDAVGNIKGSYGYMDHHGGFRHVDYVSNAEGFKAHIKTNNPGVEDKQSPPHLNIHALTPPTGIQKNYNQIFGHVQGNIDLGASDITTGTEVGKHVNNVRSRINTNADAHSFIQANIGPAVFGVDSHGNENAHHDIADDPHDITDYHSNIGTGTFGYHKNLRESAPHLKLIIIPQNMEITSHDSEVGLHDADEKNHETNVELHDRKVKFHVAENGYHANDGQHYGIDIGPRGTTDGHSIAGTGIFSNRKHFVESATRPKFIVNHQDIGIDPFEAEYGLEDTKFGHQSMEVGKHMTASWIPDSSHAIKGGQYYRKASYPSSRVKRLPTDKIPEERASRTQFIVNSEDIGNGHHDIEVELHNKKVEVEVRPHGIGEELDDVRTGHSSVEVKRPPTHKKPEENVQNSKQMTGSLPTQDSAKTNKPRLFFILSKIQPRF